MILTTNEEEMIGGINFLLALDSCDHMQFNFQCRISKPRNTHQVDRVKMHQMAASVEREDLLTSLDIHSVYSL